MWHWYTNTWQLRRLRSLLKILRMLMIVHPLGMMNHLFPGTRLEPRSDKESSEVEIVQEKEEETTPMVDVSNIVTPVNVDDEEDEIIDEVFELRRRVKGKNVEETRISQVPSPTRSPRNLSTLVILPDTEIQRNSRN
ncbi:hypothetical protein Tco_0969226 [Tanacetum coccineum]